MLRIFFSVGRATSGSGSPFVNSMLACIFKKVVSEGGGGSIVHRKTNLLNDLSKAGKIRFLSRVFRIRQWERWWHRSRLEKGLNLYKFCIHLSNIVRRNDSQNVRHTWRHEIHNRASKCFLHASTVQRRGRTMLSVPPWGIRKSPTRPCVSATKHRLGSKY